MVFALLDSLVAESEVETGDPEGVDDALSVQDVSVEQCMFAFFVGV